MDPKIPHSNPAAPLPFEAIQAEIQKELGYVFRDPALLKQALTHSSFSNETASVLPVPLADNERLEFLGDAVIGLAVANVLMDKFHEACEGKLSRWRSQLVSRKTLAEIAWEVGMGRWVLLGRGERRTGGEEKRSILAGVFEALMGALYLDAGIETARKYLAKVYEPWVLALSPTGGEGKHFDQKTFLQERTQSLYKTTPVYRVVDSWGLEHQKTFKVEIEIEGKVVAQGEGKSKKEAEQNAASVALEGLGT